MSIFTWFQKSKSVSSKRQAKPRYFLPRVEGLEQRLVPTPQTTPFSFLQAGFTQQTYGVYGNFMGGVAFASNGDVLAVSNSQLVRFDSHSTTTVHGTQIHPQTAGSPITVANASEYLGLANNPDGTIYINDGSGILDVNASTGAYLRGPFGPGGNALGIATDPQTGNLVYLGNDGNVDYVNTAFTHSGIFSANHSGDGIAFDSTGNFLFISSDGGVDIIRRNGSFVQHVDVSVGNTDGIAFASGAQKFVVTNNTNGTMARLDFPNNDFTQVPTVSTFASGGGQNSSSQSEYGDHMQVGPDGYLYLTHNRVTFYLDGTKTDEFSIVRIGPGFAPPPGVNGPVNLTHSVNMLKVSNTVALAFVTLTNNTSSDVAGDYTVTFTLPYQISSLSATNLKTWGYHNGTYFVTFSGGLKKGHSVGIAFSFGYHPTSLFDTLGHQRDLTNSSIKCTTGDNSGPV